VDKSGQHAIVLGASISGLLAARALADFYSSVTVVERDVLADGPTHRRGVPQARHAHALLSAGAAALETLFPGLLDELVADGVPRLGDGVARAWFRLGGRDLTRAGSFTDPDAVANFVVSRPVLEAHVLRRVRAHHNVTILDGHDLVDLVAEPGRITGVRIAGHHGGEERALTADLVVDAMGRGGRTPALLEKLGYDRPAEDCNVIHVAYASQLLQVPPDTVSEMLMLVGAEPDRPTGGALTCYGDGRWMLTLAGMAGHEPPTDRDGMLAFAQEFAPPPWLTVMRAAEPLNEAVRYRYPTSQWRRYDRMRRFPEGLVVFGDALCSFNPVYGQGMSVAGLEALILRQCLQEGGSELGKRFFLAAAPLINRTWKMVASVDLSIPEVQGKRTVETRTSNWYTGRVLAAAEFDSRVAEQFLRVMSLVDPPSSLLRPATAWRASTAGLRYRKVRDGQTSSRAERSAAVT
jgi:2-polyprenyl-6-methoxyphenol hydroxylase-like FAD-dependent oxidoreductase